MTSEGFLHPPESRGKLPLLLLAGLTIGIWLCVQIQQGINTNIGCVTLGALRILSGERMAEGFYHPNTPLSYLIYLPPALLIRFLGIPLYYATFVYTVALTALSTAAAWRCLVVLGIDRNTRLVFIISYLVSGTLLPGHYFGDREHLIMLGLIPLSLVQIAITRGRKPGWTLTGPVVVFGTIAALVKPQFLVVPGLLALHRLAVWRNLRAFVAADSLLIAATTLFYLAIVLVFFQDFITLILPDMLTLYVSLFRDQSSLLGAFILC